MVSLLRGTVLPALRNHFLSHVASGLLLEIRSSQEYICTVLSCGVVIDLWGAVCLKTKKNVYIYKYTTQYVNVDGDIYIPCGIYISHKGYIISHKGYIYPTRDVYPTRDIHISQGIYYIPQGIYIYPTRDILYPSGDIYIQPGIYISIRGYVNRYIQYLADTGHVRTHALYRELSVARDVGARSRWLKRRSLWLNHLLL